MNEPLDPEREARLRQVHNDRVASCEKCLLLNEIDRLRDELRQLRESVGYWSYCTRQGMLVWCPEKEPELREFHQAFGIYPDAAVLLPAKETTWPTAELDALIARINAIVVGEFASPSNTLALYEQRDRILAALTQARVDREELVAAKMAVELAEDQLAETRKMNADLARGVKKGLGLENWPEFGAVPFQDGVANLVAAIQAENEALARKIGCLEPNEHGQPSCDPPCMACAAIDHTAAAKEGT